MKVIVLMTCEKGYDELRPSKLSAKAARPDCSGEAR